MPTSAARRHASLTCIGALVVRFQQLGIIDADQATSPYEQVSKRGWNNNEPVPTTNEEPIWLERALNRRATDAAQNVRSRAAARPGAQTDVNADRREWPRSLT